MRQLYCSCMHMKNVILEKNNDVIFIFLLSSNNYLKVTKNIFFKVRIYSYFYVILRILLHYTYQLLETCNIYVTFFCMYTRTRARTHARTHAMHTASDSNYVNIIYFKYFIIIVHIRNSVISIKFFTSIKFI